MAEIAVTEVKIYTATSKKTNKEFTALRVQVGRYSTLIFPTPFELDYLKSVLAAD